MFCPFDGSKMSWESEPAAIAKCPHCGMVLQYRSSPQRFDVMVDGDGSPPATS